jgi:hypothetical protein
MMQYPEQQQNIDRGFDKVNKILASQKYHKN